MKVSIVTLALSTVVAVNESLDSEIFSTADKSFRNAYEEMFQPENDSRYNILYILYMYIYCITSIYIQLMYFSA